jgi:hypothetical protein
MTDVEKWIKQSCEREELAKKLIEMGVKDIDEFDELKNVPVEILQTWVIEELEEENVSLREKLHKAEQKEFELFFDKEVANA